MKIIIAGDGKVGLTLTQKLAAAGHDLTLIDSNQRVLDSSVERYDVMGVQGNCASMRVLESADVKKADLLIAATSSDEVNLLCGMTHLLCYSLQLFKKYRHFISNPLKAYKILLHKLFIVIYKLIKILYTISRFKATF